MRLSRLKLPHTLVLISAIMVVVAALTWIIPGGQYDRRQDQQGRELVEEETFSLVARKPQGLFATLSAPLIGIRQTADIIGFILIIGGVFAIIHKSRVIDAAIVRVATRLRHRGMVIIPAGMVLFSLSGAVFGMSEEVIPFVPIFIPLALALGYDSIVGVCIPFLGAGLGFAGAVLNPFTIGIAQGISGLPLFSGMGYRILVWLVSTGGGIIVMVMVYAARVKRRPEASPVYALDKNRPRVAARGDPEVAGLNASHRLIVGLFSVAIIVMVLGVTRFHWFIPQIAAVFLGLGIATGIAAQLSVNTIAESFVEGARDLVGAALLVGFARPTLVLASDGHIVDTMMYAISKAISRLHPLLAAQLTYVAQTVLNFFVPSGSGKAALTMPIMAPLADLIGITRQTAVLAYQLGDGYTNMIIPTSGVTMAVFMAKIPWEQWAGWLLPIEIVLFVLGLLLIVPPVLLRWGPF